MPSANYTPINTQKKVSFGDDCGPDYFTYHQAMKKMSGEKYVIKGDSTPDAFGKFYDDVVKTMQKVKETEAAKPKKSFIFSESEVVVQDWEMAKETFVNTMSNFWKHCKKDIPLNDDSFKAYRATDKVISNYLENVENISKKGKGFLGKIFGNPNFYEKWQFINEVTECFIQKGLHKLK